MRVYNLLLLTFLLAPLIIAASGRRISRPDCSKKANGAFLSDPESCSCYYVCRNGRSLRRHCGRGLYFDRRTSVCNVAALVDCSNSQGLLSDEFGVLKDPEVTTTPSPQETSPPISSTDCTPTTPCPTTKPTECVTTPTTPCATTKHTDCVTTPTTPCATTKPTDCVTTPETPSPTTKPTECASTPETPSPTTKPTECASTPKTPSPTTKPTECATTPITPSPTTKPTECATTPSQTTKPTECATTPKPTDCVTTPTTTTCPNTTTTTICPITTTACPTPTTTCPNLSTSSTTESPVSSTTEDPKGGADAEIFSVNRYYVRKSNNCAQLKDGTFLLDAKHCRRFYVCFQGKAKRLKCTAGHWFDRDAKLCRNKRDVNNCPAHRN